MIFSDRLDEEMEETADDVYKFVQVVKTNSEHQREDNQSSSVHGASKYQDKLDPSYVPKSSSNKLEGGSNIVTRSVSSLDQVQYLSQ